MKRAISELIGFQVATNNLTLHPLMEDNACIYSLMQIQQMLLNTPARDNNAYNIIRVYTGDVEKPTMMFTGSLFTSDGCQGEVDPLGDE